MREKAVYYRESVKVNGKVKSKWIRVPGVAVKYGTEELLIKTDNKIDQLPGPAGTIWKPGYMGNPNYDIYENTYEGEQDE